MVDSKSSAQVRKYEEWRRFSKTLIKMEWWSAWTGLF